MEEAERINNVEGGIYTFPAPHRRMGHGGMIDHPSTPHTMKKKKKTKNRCLKGEANLFPKVQFS
jgi:hypothetical protein